MREVWPFRIRAWKGNERKDRRMQRGVKVVVWGPCSGAVSFSWGRMNRRERTVKETGRGDL